MFLNERRFFVNELYRLEKADLPKAAEILATAFSDDPLAKAFEGLPNSKELFAAFFQVPLTYAHKYGEVYATSEHLEGIIAWTPGHVADMSIWRMLRSGALSPAIKMGKTYNNIKPFFTQATKDRKRFMKGKDFLYLAVIGVSPEEQGKGYGKTLIHTFIAQGEKNRIPLYLETETEENASLYHHFDFNTLNHTVIPEINMPFWAMARESN